jgi:hypothetical protein
MERLGLFFELRSRFVVAVLVQAQVSAQRDASPSSLGREEDY